MSGESLSGPGSNPGPEAPDRGLVFGMAVKRIWRGWTTPENADAYQTLLREVVKPGIEAKDIPGYHSLQLLRRDLEEEVESMTIMTGLK